MDANGPAIPIRSRRFDVAKYKATDRSFEDSFDRWEKRKRGLYGGVGGRLYEAYQGRRYGPHASACLSDAVHWVLLAATSGVVGGLAYDVAKAVVARVSGRENTDLAELFSEVIERADYDRELASSRSAKSDPELGDQRIEEYAEEVRAWLEEMRAASRT